MKKTPIRFCEATKQRYPKNELFRVIKTQDGEVVLDISGKISSSGKGAYILMNEEAIQIAKKSKCLDKKLEIEVPDSIYERMSKYLKMK